MDHKTLLRIKNLKKIKIPDSIVGVIFEFP